MRVQAPFGRRRGAVTGVDDVGAYRVVHVADLDGPQPWPGQFYMLATVEGWGAGATSARSCRARCPSSAPPTGS